MPKQKGLYFLVPRFILSPLSGLSSFSGRAGASFYNCLDLTRRPLRSKVDSCSHAEAVMRRAAGFGVDQLKNYCSIVDRVTSADYHPIRIPAARPCTD